MQRSHFLGLSLRDQAGYHYLWHLLSINITEAEDKETLAVMEKYQPYIGKAAHTTGEEKLQQQSRGSVTPVLPRNVVFVADLLLWGRRALWSCILSPNPLNSTVRYQGRKKRLTGALMGEEVSQVQD